MKPEQKENLEYYKQFIAKKAVRVFENYIKLLEDLARDSDFVMDKDFEDFEYDIVDCFIDAIWTYDGKYAHVLPEPRVPTRSLANYLIGLSNYMNELPNERKYLGRELGCLGRMLESAVEKNPRYAGR